MKKIKYVIVVRSYFDKEHGNSYFGGRVIDTDSGEFRQIPFQYGRGDDEYMRAAADSLGLTTYDVTHQNSCVEEVRVSTMREAKRYEAYTGLHAI
jgi:hypothetical protein